MTESEATRLVCINLRAHNSLVLNIAGGIDYQTPGLPDRFICHRRLRGGAWVEFKIGSGKLSALQKINIRQMRERHVNAFVAYHGPSGRIEDQYGNVLSAWDGTGRDMIEVLERLINDSSTPSVNNI